MTPNREASSAPPVIGYEKVFSCRETTCEGCLNKGGNTLKNVLGRGKRHGAFFKLM